MTIASTLLWSKATALPPRLTRVIGFPAVKLTAKQQTEKVQRADKTGSRTFPGYPNGLRIETSFGLTTYMATWNDPGVLPPYGPLFQACLGAGVAQSAGGNVASASGSSTLTFTAPHGLSAGAAVSTGGEIRFVTVVVNAEYRSTQCAVFGHSCDEFANRADGDVSARGESSERDALRLLEPFRPRYSGYSGAWLSIRSR